MAENKAPVKRPTRNDVAALANVSGCTVSYILGGRTDVSIADATRDRVIAAAKQLGYRPNHAARALVTGATQVVSLLAGRLSPYYTMVASQLQSQAVADGFQVLLADAVMGQSPKGGVWSGDGIIAIDYPEQVEAYLQTHPDLRTPLVSIGAFHLEQVDFVGVDLYRGVREAMSHLLQGGSRRIAYVRGEDPRSKNDPRSLGYVDAVTEAALPIEEIVLSGSTRSHGRNEVKAYIEKFGCPDGLLCHNDELAIGVYRGLLDLGISVPGQVKLIGCDGIEDVEYLEQPITTIVQPVDQMCRTAWEFLRNRMVDPSIQLQQRVFNAELVVRGSSTP